MKKKINVKPHSSDFKHRGCAELGVSRIFTVLRQDDRCLLQIINKRLSVGKKIHKDKTNNEIVFIEENEAGTQAQNKFVVYWNTVKWFRYCYKIIFISYAEDLGQWGCSRFPWKLKLSPKSHREVQTAPARLRETQIPAKHRDFWEWECMDWPGIAGSEFTSPDMP